MNNEENEQIEHVQIGFYAPVGVELSGNDSEKISADIFRILGFDNRKNKWKSLDGRYFTTTTLLNDYVFIGDSNQKGESLSAKSKKHLFSGLDSIINNSSGKNSASVYVEEPDEVEEKTFNPVELYMESNADTLLDNDKINRLIAIEVAKRTTNQEVIQPKQKHKFDYFLVDLFEKFDNKKLYEKFGEVRPPQKLIVNLEFEINYDLEKIKQSIKLLDLDTRSVSKYLIHLLTEENSNFDDLLSMAIEQNLVSILNKEPIITEKEIAPIENIAPKENIIEKENFEKTKEINTIETLSEEDSEINSFLSKAQNFLK